MKLILLLFFTLNVYASTITHKTDGVKIGKNLASDVFIYADTGNANDPYLKFKASTSEWVQSTDGVAESVLGSSVTTTEGDLILRGAAQDARLAIGTINQVLTSTGTTASWQVPQRVTPTTTQNDIIFRGASADERLAIGTATQVLTVSALGAPEWDDSAVLVFTPNTVQRFTSGSGTYTTPAGVKYIKVTAVGGGGGSGGSGTSGGTAAGSGGNSTFGTSLITANGGAPGVWGGAGTAGGSGGSISLSAPAIFIHGLAGSNGFPYSPYNTGTVFTSGAMGGSSMLGVSTAYANSGAGGQGGGSGGVAVVRGNSGGGGGGLVIIINSPAASYSYAIGGGGTAGGAGTSGQVGQAGGSGIIIVEEYYQ